MLDVVHMPLHLRSRHLAAHMATEIGLIIIDVHAAPLQEQPQLSPPLMLQMTVLLQPLVQVHHARREESFPQSIHIFDIEFELVVDGTLVEAGGVEGVEGLPQKAAHLVLDVVVEHLGDHHFHLLEFLSQEVSVEIDD